jgi:glycosyltransferase involved in cell wall biosynthesis
MGSDRILQESVLGPPQAAQKASSCEGAETLPVRLSSLERMVLVTAGYFPDSRGGAERQAKILAEALARRGVHVTLAVPTTWADAPPVEQTSFGQIERFRVKAYPNSGGRHMLDFLAWTRWFQTHIAPRLGPDTPVYVFHARLHALGPALAARAAGAPLLIKLGGGGEASDFAALRAKKYLYGTWVQNRLVRQTNAFVANSSQIANDLRLLGVESERIASFPNGVELPADDLIETAIAARSGRRFVSSGRMVPDKNVGVLYDAVAAVARDDRQIKVAFLGEGPERERLSTIASAAGLEDCLDFPGFVSDVYPYLTKSDFFFSASMREGQSNALLEAMSAGVIPIVYGASGAEVVADGTTGFVVNRSDAASFERAIRDAMALTPARRIDMAQAARAFAKAHIGIDAIADMTIELMQRLIARR